MGGSLSQLRAEIKQHTNTARRYPHFLEPILSVAQYFLETAEEGEGLKNCEDAKIDAALQDPNRINYLSSAVELITESTAAIDVILNAIFRYDQLELAPEIDPTKGIIFGIQKRKIPMPKFAEIEERDVPRYRIAVLRLSVRTLRIICICEEVQNRIYKLDGETWLSRIALENPNDDYIKSDIKRIFRTIYGQEKAIRRIAVATMLQVIDLMTEYPDNSLVQLEGIKRLHVLIHQDDQGEKTSTVSDEMLSVVRQNELLSLIGSSLSRFHPNDIEIFVASFRFYLSVANDLRCCKIIGQYYGIDAAILILKHARGFHISQALNNNDTESPFQQYRSTNPLANINSTEVAQMALWVLDAVCHLEYNLQLMQKQKLKFVFNEIQSNPNTKIPGSKLIMPKRLKLINWQQSNPAQA